MGEDRGCAGSGAVGSRILAHCSPCRRQAAAVPQRSPECAPRCCEAPWAPAWSAATPTTTALGTPSAAPPAAATTASHPLRVKPPRPPGRGGHPLGCTHFPLGLPVPGGEGGAGTRLLCPRGSGSPSPEGCTAHGRESLTLSSLHMCQCGPGSAPPRLLVARRLRAPSCACRTATAPSGTSAAGRAAAGPASPRSG